MPGNQPIEPLDLARALIRCDSVTPREGGALDVLQSALETLGFSCHRLTFSEAGTDDVENLYARRGHGAPHFCFAGHTDVVPVGDEAAWSRGPFDAEVAEGVLYGRGASDMKGAIAAFVSAADRFLSGQNVDFDGSISLLITGDEEGPAVNGTVKVLDWLEARGERIDHCLVGEPTNPDTLGEMVKIGRRGSLTGVLTVNGVQGHVAYPHLADNPVPRMLDVLQALNARELDQGNEFFPPSNLEITTVDVGNPATNVIPARASATFNIRFNTEQTSAGLRAWIEDVCAQAGEHELRITVGAEPFLTEPGEFTDIIAGAVAAVTGRRPELGTTGGTSDARFIYHHCPVAEFGLIGQTMHKVDEQADVADIDALSEIYYRILGDYFA
jgi:succinyl-diaminopimelate desuccinylase